MNIINRIYKLTEYIRKRRMKKFIKAINPDKSTTILDVGGTPLNWSLINYKYKSNIILYNIEVPSKIKEILLTYKFIQGDGIHLCYHDQAFDVVFSNSVIEHVGDYQDQRKFAKEIMRVGKKIWVQTPASSFLIEPHLVTPFIHYFPYKIQNLLVRYFTLWGIVTKPSKEQSDAFLKHIRLLRSKEIKELFPSCEIRKERFLFMTKCYIAVKN